MAQARDRFGRFVSKRGSAKKAARRANPWKAYGRGIKQRIVRTSGGYTVVTKYPKVRKAQRSGPWTDRKVAEYIGKVARKPLRDKPTYRGGAWKSVGGPTGSGFRGR